MFGFGLNFPDSQDFAPSIIAGPTSGITPTSDYRYVYVYAKAGETINIGTNYTERNPDIAVIFPDGSSRTYDIPNRTSGTVGYIANYLQERNGPSTACKTTDCLNYYTPIKIDVTQEGIYKIAFYSSEWQQINQIYDYSPKKSFLTTENLVSWAGTIAAWDVSVTDNSKNIIPGRVYFYILYGMQSVGDFNRQSYSFLSFYVLTSDGVIYKTQYPQIDGGVFALASNKRGLVDSITDTSIHHTALNTDDLNRFAVRNTSKDEYYRMFLNEPDRDLLNYLGLNSVKSIEISNFKFEGDYKNVTKISNGGTFSFLSSSGDGSFQIDVVFNNGSKVSLSNSIVQGLNTITWNGKDNNGNIIGTPNQVVTGTASLNILFGETHNILYDIELNPGGIKIDVLNGPSAGDGIVYYDNSEKEINGYAFTETFDGNDYSISGINSKTNAALSFNNFEGNLVLIDFWTYSKEQPNNNAIIVVTNEITSSIRVNKIWQDDENRDGFRPERITVRLLQDDTEYATATIDDSAPNIWTYTFTDIPKYKTDGSAYVYYVEEVDY